ncbi:hypothetical protein GCM10025873_12690 [Demequina sediminis]|nr:hypothetical protein GCM10025873_12690 [Demequina sediminis]
MERAVARRAQRERAVQRRIDHVEQRRPQHGARIGIGSGLEARAKIREQGVGGACTDVGEQQRLLELVPVVLGQRSAPEDREQRLTETGAEPAPQPAEAVVDRLGCLDGGLARRGLPSEGASGAGATAASSPCEGRGGAVRGGAGRGGA